MILEFKLFMKNKVIYFGYIINYLVAICLLTSSNKYQNYYLGLN